MRIVVAVLHVGMVIAFGFAALLYLGNAGAGRPPFSSYYSYHTGSYLVGLIVFTFLPLILLGVCFLFCVPHPQKWLPSIGLALLVWEGPIFPGTSMIYYLFPESLRPAVPSGIGVGIAVLGCCAAAWQGVYLYRRRNGVPAGADPT